MIHDSIFTTFFYFFFIFLYSIHLVLTVVFLFSKYSPFCLAILSFSFLFELRVSKLASSCNIFPSFLSFIFFHLHEISALAFVVDSNLYIAS